MEEELRRKMAELILDFQTPNDNEIWDEYTLTDQILTLIREVGWIPQIEIKSLIDKAADIIGTEESLRSIACIEVALDWLQRRVEERKDWKSPEEVDTISQWFEKGRKSVLRTNPSGCSCLFDEQDNIVSVCGAHQDWYEEKIKEPQ